MIEPVAFSEDFAEDPLKQSQWKALIRKGRLELAPKELKEVIPILRGFLEPVVASILKEKPARLSWTAPGPWVEKE